MRAPTFQRDPVQEAKRRVQEREARDAQKRLTFPREPKPRPELARDEELAVSRGYSAEQLTEWQPDAAERYAEQLDRELERAEEAAILDEGLFNVIFQETEPMAATLTKARKTKATPADKGRRHETNGHGGETNGHPSETLGPAGEDLELGKWIDDDEGEGPEWLEELATPELLQAAAEAYSADTITGKKPKLKTFEFWGGQWTCLAVCHKGHGIEWAHIADVYVATELPQGLSYDPCDRYAGMDVGKWIIGGRRVRLVAQVGDDEDVSRETVSPDATGTSTPAGIAVNDPDAVQPNGRKNGKRRGKEPLTPTLSPEYRGEGENQEKSEPAAVDDASLKRAAQLAERLLEELPGERQLEGKLLVRHPRNRRPAKEDIAARAASLKADGQLEPLVVREWDLHCGFSFGFGPGQFQIISGETRWLGGTDLGWKTFRCRVIRCDDETAYELVLKHNLERKQLTVLERAEALYWLTRPKEEGGNALTREQAGAIVKGEDGKPLGGPAVSNLVRLRELPPFWQQLVNAGDIPQAHARLLTRYTHVPQILEAIEKQWSIDHGPNANHWQADRWENDFEGVMDDAASNAFAPMVKAKNRHDHGRQFDVDDATREKLQIVEIEEVTGHGKGRKTAKVEVALNTDLWNELQEAAEAKLAKDAAAKAGRDKASQKKLTPAQQKAKAQEQADQLGKRIDGWRHQWLKELVAIELTESDLAEIQCDVVAQFSCWLMTAPLGELDLLEALAEANGQGKKHSWEIDAWKLVAGHGAEDLLASQIAMIAYLLRREDSDPRSPLLDTEIVDSAAEYLGLDLAEKWQELQADHSELDRARFESFFLLFQSGQLDQLGEELGVHVALAKTKDRKVALFAQCPRTLKLPKCIKRLAKRGATAKPAKKKPRAK